MERDTAIHVWVRDLLAGTFMQTEDSPSAITLKNGTTLKRARLYGTVVSTNELIIDDSTGSILVRSFDLPFTITIGNPVLVIGRPRLYNNQHYLLGEIVKEIDPAWLTITKKQHPLPTQNSAPTSPLDIVRSLDSGDGANYDHVIAKLGSNGEDTITHLLAIGELFETRPGKLKVLE